jgi:hypothetical protein
LNWGIRAGAETVAKLLKLPACGLIACPAGQFVRAGVARKFCFDSELVTWE